MDQEFLKASDVAYEKIVIKKHLVPRDLTEKSQLDIEFERGSLPSMCFDLDLLKTIPEEKVSQIANIILQTYSNAGVQPKHSLSKLTFIMRSTDLHPRKRDDLRSSALFQKFLVQFRRQSRYNRRSQVGPYCMNTDLLAKPSVVDSSRAFTPKLLQKLLKQH